MFKHCSVSMRNVVENSAIKGP